MKAKRLLIVSAVLEGATGLALLAAPSAVVVYLAGAGLDGPAAILVGRITGAALLGIGLSCGVEGNREPGREQRGLVLGLLVYNVAVPILLVSAALSAGLRGLLFWPVCIAHAALAIWCVRYLREG